MTALPNIVLVHGAWADGSSRSAVIAPDVVGRRCLSGAHREELR
jgi:hypothetical protein